MATTEIVHRVGIRAAAPDVFDAIVQPERLVQWWPEGAAVRGRGEPAAGCKLDVRFSAFVQTFTIDVLERPTRIRWKAGDEGAPYWAGTEVEFRLERDEAKDQTLVYFRHGGWSDGGPMLYKSGTHWGVYLLSLKDLLEGRPGRPYPDMWAADHD